MSSTAIICALVGAGMLYIGVKALYYDMDNEESWITTGIMCFLAVGFGIFTGGVTSLWN